MKESRGPRQVGRDDVAVMLSSEVGCQLETSKNILRALFGAGGSGPAGGERTVGIIETLLDRGSEVNIRGFGCFRRSSFKARKSRINGVMTQCRAKRKLSFRASEATDIVE